MLDGSSDSVSVTHLIISHGASEVPDEAIQNIAMVNILEEPHNAVLRGKRFELCNNPNQLSTGGQRDRIICRCPLKGVVRTS